MDMLLLSGGGGSSSNWLPFLVPLLLLAGILYGVPILLKKIKHLRHRDAGGHHH